MSLKNKLAMVSFLLSHPKFINQAHDIVQEAIQIIEKGETLFQDFQNEKQASIWKNLMNQEPSSIDEDEPNLYEDMEHNRVVFHISLHSILEHLNTISLPDNQTLEEGERVLLAIVPFQNEADVFHSKVFLPQFLNNRKIQMECEFSGSISKKIGNLQFVVKNSQKTLLSYCNPFYNFELGLEAKQVSVALQVQNKQLFLVFWFE